MTTLTVAGPEVRTFAITETRAEKGSKFFETLTGRAVPYDRFENIGWFHEAHAPGSFTKTIRENPSLPLLLFHDSRKFPIGKVAEWRDQDDGLHAVWELDTASDAQEAARLADKGMLNGLSIGFVPIRSNFEDREGVDYVTRLESRLLEVSVVGVPAFSGATIAMVRSRDADRLAAERPEREWVASSELRAWQDWLRSVSV